MLGGLAGSERTSLQTRPFRFNWADIWPEQLLSLALVIPSAARGRSHTADDEITQRMIEAQAATQLFVSAA